MDSILQFLAPIAAFIVAKVPVIGVIAANGVAALIAVGLLVEILEVVSVATKTVKDDVLAAKLKKIVDKVMAVVEVFPHVNIPVVAAIAKFSRFLVKAKAVIVALIGAIKKD